LEICLGAILTQNTSWSNVARVLTLLAREKVLNIERLRRLPRRELERLLRSSGYFRQKAKRVRLFLDTVHAHFGSSIAQLLSGPLEKTRARLLALHGVGPETADSMLLYAGGRPTFVVDAYTRRITSRWGLIKGRESYDEIQTLYMQGLPGSPKIFAEYHALLVELAKKNCRPRPICGSCPVNTLCAFGKEARKERG
jgi:endonuclease-3 related protein